MSTSGWWPYGQLHTLYFQPMELPCLSVMLLSTADSSPSSVSKFRFWKAAWALATLYSRCCEPSRKPQPHTHGSKLTLTLNAKYDQLSLKYTFSAPTLIGLTTPIAPGAGRRFFSPATSLTSPVTNVTARPQPKHSWGPVLEPVVSNQVLFGSNVSALGTWVASRLSSAWICVSTSCYQTVGRTMVRTTMLLGVTALRSTVMDDVG